MAAEHAREVAGIREAEFVLRGHVALVVAQADPPGACDAGAEELDGVDAAQAVRMTITGLDDENLPLERGISAPLSAQRQGPRSTRISSQLE